MSAPAFFRARVGQEMTRGEENKPRLQIAKCKFQICILQFAILFAKRHGGSFYESILAARVVQACRRRLRCSVGERRDKPGRRRRSGAARSDRASKQTNPRTESADRRAAQTARCYRND